MNLSFKNRIALHYLLATAVLTAVVFILIFQVVQSSVYLHLDGDLLYEAHKHSKEIRLDGDRVIFRNKTEWEEREHREVVVNPVFIQVVGLDGKIMDKSPNLKEDALDFARTAAPATPFDALLKDRSVRQVQIPINFSEQRKGYLLTAMSLENSLSVLTRLRNILLFSFPVVLLFLFLITRLIAARSIRPITTMTRTADNITRNNLQQRIELPRNRDELFSLANSINHLLDRLQRALEREKQFTADASHELRTPLTVLKGTLEVLIRKPRTQAEYEARVGEVIQEINRMGIAVEQLLTLARVENFRLEDQAQEINLLVLLDEVVHRYSDQANRKGLKIHIDQLSDSTLRSDPHLVELLLDNIISNAVKYSREEGQIHITVDRTVEAVHCIVEDQGVGIKDHDLDLIYQPFFRSGALEQKHIKGNGLGLAIVKKVSELIDAKVHIDSRFGEGTRAELQFPLEFQRGK